MKVNLRFLTWFQFLLLVASSNGWTASSSGNQDKSTRFFHRLAAATASSTETTTRVTNDAFNYTAEVVGASGRMGSFWLCHGTSKEGAAAFVPRGVSPGCLSPPNCPIFVATPSGSWSHIWNQTLPERRQDLVFVGNGVPPPDFSEATILVPHFAVLEICRLNDDTYSNPPIGTSVTSPKSLIYGKHANYTAQVLEAHGVSTESVSSFADIRAASARKLLWASCLWLLCHSNITTPMTVAEVHDGRQDRIDRLVDELLPALEQLVGQPQNRTQLLEYLEAYSRSIPNAIPSKQLAIAELKERNGVWLALQTKEHPQTLHQQLLQSLTDKETLNDLLTSDRANVGILSTSRNIVKLDLKDVGLVVWGKPFQPRPVTPKTVVIVGGGIVGSSVALFLAQRRPDWKITVLDQLSSNDVGRTTPASWAWLNANGKYPKSYQILNQLGIHAWKRQAHLSSLPSWMGSLVRFESIPDFVNDGGYPVEGPLCNERILQLEPFANWKLADKEQDGSDAAEEGYTYFFSDEGCVDPSLAVRTLRRAAMELGVRFVANQNVTNVLRNPQTGQVDGVESHTPDDVDSESAIIPADLVVVAAGVGAAAPALGGLPLLYRPGQIAYASPTTTNDRLSRILVDPMRSSHILQRPDGSIVAGGGALEVGGTSGATSSEANKSSQEESFLEGARQLAPLIVDKAEFQKCFEAVRPMPSDGLPVVGYVQQGLYTIVMHSGITLGPVVAALAAGEISENICCKLLGPYRPARFDFKAQNKN